MALKELLVIADNDTAFRSRLDVAFGLAMQHGARVVGLHVMPPPLTPFYGEVPIPEAVEKAQRLELEEAARRAAALFASAAAHTAVPTEWRVAEGPVLREAKVHARYADLSVVPQGIELGSPSADLHALPEELALGVGRPVLVIPRYGSFRSTGRRVLVAWNGSREATRAVHDALPLLQRAERVTVLSIDPTVDPDGSRLPGADIALYLARHGAVATAATIPGADMDVGDLLLSYATDHDADLIVMGAYGHTRLREMVLGGATRTLLQHMTVPVLLSH
ncbi:MAG TPA: universal stress protein [Methylomirabilota bacterium]|nr:universal stress protein [Methylomirabilota bacterium]